MKYLPWILALVVFCALAVTLKCDRDRWRRGATSARDSLGSALRWNEFREQSRAAEIAAAAEGNPYQRVYRHRPLKLRSVGGQPLVGVDDRGTLWRLRGVGYGNTVFAESVAVRAEYTVLEKKP